MADSMALPKIVAAIREQKPGVVPEPLHWDTDLESWNWWPDDPAEYNDDLCESIVIAVLEAAMWPIWCEHVGINHQRHIHKHDVEGWRVRDFGKPGGPIYRFGSDPLALIRALCYAIGVRLEGGDGD